MAIDFDGTNDGIDVDISQWGTITACWWSFRANYDTAAGERPVLCMEDSGDPNSWLRLYKRNTGTIWELQAHIGSGGSETSVTVSNTLSVSTWWCVQAYASLSGDTVSIGLRSSTSDTPGAYTTGSAGSFTGWQLDTCKLGYGNSQFYNGRLAEVTGASATKAEVDSFGLGDGLMRAYATPAYMAPIFDYMGSMAYTPYWPMHSASHLKDVFSSTALSLVDAPATHASHPRIIYPRHGRRIIHPAPAVTTRRVSLGGFYKTTGNRVVLVG